MSHLLSKDMTFKIVSIVFELVLWFFVLSDSNPVQRVDIVVPLSIENRNSLDAKSLGQKGQIVQKDVVVTIEDRSQRLKTITSNDISAVLDFAQIDSAGLKDLDINVTSKKEDIKIKQVFPQSIRVSVEGMIQKTFDIEVKTEVKLKENFVIIGTSVIPQAINVSGLESVITSVSSVKAFIKDINDLDKNLILKTDCYFYNQKAEEIFDFNKKYYVDIKLDVAKKVTVMPIVKGVPAKDFYQAEVTVSPKTVLITGSPEILNQISDLKVELVDIENLNRSISEKHNILLPEGVKIADLSQEAEVSVTINKMPIKDYTIFKNNITFVGQEDAAILKYEIISSETILKLMGAPVDQNNVITSLLKPQINVTGLTEGTYRVPLNVTLPPKISLTQDVYVEIIITKVAKVPV